MKNIIPYIVILNLTFFILFSFSCEQKKKETPEERADRLEKAVEDKFTKRRVERMTECKEDAIRIAEQRVDSILLAQAKLISIDTTGRPIKPIKPGIPIVKKPTDSTEVKPLFEGDPDSIQ